MARPLASVAALVALYYALPLDGRPGPRRVAVLAAGLCLVAGTAAWQVRAILRSPSPLSQGVQALAVVVPLFLLVFAAAYHVLAGGGSGAFTEPLTRTDALYFAVTVFATVGFGDVAPVTEAARVLVTAQMVGDLVVVGGVLRVLVVAVRVARDRAQGRAQGRAGRPSGPE